jgi:hypothetical protein
LPATLTVFLGIGGGFILVPGDDLPARHAGAHRHRDEAW